MPVDLDLGGRVALVTGAGQGIGRAIARRLAEHGADLVVNDVVAERAEAVAGEVTALGRRALAAVYDVTDPDAVARMAAAAGALGRVTILVNNAGVPPPAVARRTAKPFVETSPADWEPYLRTSLYAVLLVTRALLPAMCDARWGRVVTVVSEAGRQGEPRLAAYAAAKAGAAGFVRSIAREVAALGVTANCVSLGGVRTESLEALLPAEMLEKIARSYPVGRLGAPDDVADIVTFLCSPAASWITGQVYPVNGGFAAS